MDFIREELYRYKNNGKYEYKKVVEISFEYLLEKIEAMENDKCNRCIYRNICEWDNDMEECVEFIDEDEYEFFIDIDCDWTEMSYNRYYKSSWDSLTDGD